MSAVTLETLRADVIREFDALGDKLGCEGWGEDYEPLLAALAYKPGEGVEIWDTDIRAGKDAVTLYVIARDYSLDAALLYKMSGGNIDPRKEVG